MNFKLLKYLLTLVTFFAHVVQSIDCPPLSSYKLVMESFGCGASTLPVGASNVSGHTVASCNDYCLSFPTCVWFALRPSDGSCRPRTDCSLTADESTTGKNAYRPTGYI